MLLALTLDEHCQNYLLFYSLNIFYWDTVYTLQVLALGLRRRNDGSLLVIGESVHVSRVQFWSCRSGSSCCTARHQGC